MSVDLTPRERRILDALRFLADDESKVTVAQRDLATALGWRRHSGIRNTIVSLERRGLIHVRNNDRELVRRPNTFEVTALGHLVAEAGQGWEAA